MSERSLSDRLRRSVPGNLRRRDVRLRETGQELDEDLGVVHRLILLVGLEQAEFPLDLYGA